MGLIVATPSRRSLVGLLATGLGVRVGVFMTRKPVHGLSSSGILWGVPGVVVAAVATYLSRVWRLREHRDQTALNSHHRRAGPTQMEPTRSGRSLRPDTRGSFGALI